MKKILLVLSVCMLALIGCSSSSDNNSITGVTPGEGGETTVPTDPQETVESAFYDSYAVHVTGIPAEGMSQQAKENVVALIRNITGKGQMPAAVGIGEVTNAETASAMAHIIAGSSVSAELTVYSNLDVNSNTFIQTVMTAFMSGTDGTKLLNSLKTINKNSDSIILLANDYSARLQGTPEQLSQNARENIVYLFANLPGYLDNVNNSIPAETGVISGISQTLYGLNDVTKLYTTYDKPNTEFKVMNVLAPDGNYTALLTFVSAIEEIVKNSGGTSGGGEETPETDFVMQAFPSMFIKLLDGFPGGDAAQTPKENGQAFFQAMLDNGAEKPLFDPAALNRQYAPVVASALKAKGFSYADFEKDAASFKSSVTDVFFSDEEAKTNLIKEFNNVPVLNMYLDSYVKLIKDAPAEGVSSQAGANIKYCFTTVIDMFLNGCEIPAEQTKIDYVASQFASIAEAMTQYATFDKTSEEFSMMTIIQPNMQKALEVINNIKKELGCPAS